MPVRVLLAAGQVGEQQVLPAPRVQPHHLLPVEGVRRRDGLVTDAGPLRQDPGHEDVVDPQVVPGVLPELV